MSWEDFESEREARNFGAEMYKKLIIKYFQTQGYYLRKNSLFEGILSDIIMEKGNEIIWIEAKNTYVSIFAKSDPLRREIFQYFYYWLISKEEKKFNLVIFAINLTKKNETKNVLTNEAIDSAILNWYNEKSNLKLDDKILNKLNSAKNEDIIKFFKSISVKICSPFGLHQRVKKREKELRKSPSAYYKKLLKEVKNRKDPIKKKTNIIINFLELEYPNIFYEVTSKYRLKKTFYKKLNPKKDSDIRFPEFVVPRFESLIPVVRSFERNLNPLRPYIIGEIYERNIDDLSTQRRRELLYTSLRRYLWCKGLRRSNIDFYFAYEQPLEIEPEEKASPIEIKGIQKAKIVTRPRYKENGTLNFVEHHSVNIRLEEYDGKFGLSIWPGFRFTSDGVNLITGDHASRIHRKYLKPEWNRNLNKRGLIKFWEHFLIQDNFIREKDSWFNTFKIKPLLIEEMGWSSETIKIDEQRIDIFLKNGEF